jgi:hypothetical protein
MTLRALACAAAAAAVLMLPGAVAPPRRTRGNGSPPGASARLACSGSRGSTQNRGGRWPSFVRSGGGRTRDAAPAGIARTVLRPCHPRRSTQGPWRMATHALAPLAERARAWFGLRLGWRVDFGEVKRHSRALSCGVWFRVGRGFVSGTEGPRAEPTADATNHYLRPRVDLGHARAWPSGRATRSAPACPLWPPEQVRFWLGRDVVGRDG